MKANTPLILHSTNIFKDTLSRVYDSFANTTLITASLKDFLNPVFSLENNKPINQEGSVFSFSCHSIYTSRVIVKDVTVSEHYCSYTHHMTNPSGAEEIIVMKFYYNTCDNETLYVNHRYINDSKDNVFFSLSMDKQLSQLLFKGIEEYLDKTRVIGEQMETIALYKTVDDAWSILLDWYMSPSNHKPLPNSNSYKMKLEEKHGEYIEIGLIGLSSNYTLLYCKHMNNDVYSHEGILSFVLVLRKWMKAFRLYSQENCLFQDINDNISNHFQREEQHLCLFLFDNDD